MNETKDTVTSLKERESDQDRPESTFLSYSREDSDFCLKLANDLKNAGTSIWMDQLDIHPGQRWDDAIEQAIKNATAMVVVLSPSAAESSNVRDEINYALDQNDLVVPVLYKNCNVPFRLHRIQYVDFTDDYKSSFAELLVRLGSDRTDHQRTLETHIDQSRIRKYGKLLATTFTLLAIMGFFLFKYFQPIPTFGPPPNRTIVDVDGNGVERVSLNAATQLSDGTNVQSYEWRIGDKLLGNVSDLGVELNIGKHELSLSVMGANNQAYSNNVIVNIISQSQQDEVEVLLELAYSNIEQATANFDPYLLTEGVSSASGAITRVLELDPYNRKAKMGLEQIADIYTEQARSLVQNGNINKATILINRGLDVVANHAGLNDLKTELKL